LITGVANLLLTSHARYYCWPTVWHGHCVAECSLTAVIGMISTEWSPKRVVNSIVELTLFCIFFSLVVVSDVRLITRTCSEKDQLFKTESAIAQYNFLMLLNFYNSYDYIYLSISISFPLYFIFSRLELPW